MIASKNISCIVDEQHVISIVEKNLEDQTPEFIQSTVELVRMLLSIGVSLAKLDMSDSCVNEIGPGEIRKKLILKDILIMSQSKDIEFELLNQIHSYLLDLGYTNFMDLTLDEAMRSVSQKKMHIFTHLYLIKALESSENPTSMNKIASMSNA